MWKIVIVVVVTIGTAVWLSTDG